MLVPLKDNNPLQVIRFQSVTLMIIILNVAVYLLTGPLAQASFTSAVTTVWGVVPVELLHPGMVTHVSTEPVPELLTLVTYMFLHAGLLHIAFNMLFLWVFADNIEDAFGHVAFALFYILCGAAGGLAHALMDPTSQVPVIGASGAVSGVLGAYLLLYPKARLWVIFFLPIPFRVPAVLVLGVWFTTQIMGVYAAGASEDMTAWWAHIGGFVTGLLLTLLLRSRLLVKA